MAGADQDIESAIRKLEADGHTVRPYNQDGVFWFSIDGRMLASYKEMKEIGKGAYNLNELEELMKKRLDVEQGTP